MPSGYFEFIGLEIVIVIVANNLPDAVRGKIKLWFVEPRPNVFVSGIKDSLADRVIEMLMDKCPLSSGLLIFKTSKEAPFYRIYAKGETKKKITTITGMQMILDSSAKN